MSPPGPPIIRRSPTAGRVHCADSGSCLSATTYVAVVNGCVCEVGLSLFFFWRWTTSPCLLVVGVMDLWGSSWELCGLANADVLLATPWCRSSQDNS